LLPAGFCGTRRTARREFPGTMSVEYKGFSLMEDGEGGAGPKLTSNQVRMLQAREGQCCPNHPWKLPMILIGIMSFIALILGSVAIDKSDSNDDSTSSTQTCPYGDIIFGDDVHEYNGHYFQVIGSSSGAINWPEAVRDAASRCYNGNAGYLANIGTEAEQTFLYALWQNHTGFSSDSATSAWIGAADLNEESQFEWIGPGKMSVGVPFYDDSTGAIDGAYTNWASGEPNESGSEDCVEMRSGQGYWNDRECYGSNKFFFVEFGDPSTEYLE